VHTPSLVDIDIGTLSHVHREPKNPYPFGESTGIITRHTFTTSFAIPIFGIQIGENTSTLPSSNTIDSDSVFYDDLPIAFRNGKHACTSHLIPHFVSYSHLSFFLSCFYSSLDSYFVPKS